MVQGVLSFFEFTKNIAGPIFLIVIAISVLMTLIIFYHINFFGIAGNDKKVAKKIFITITAFLLFLNGLATLFVYYG